MECKKHKKIAVFCANCLREAITRAKKEVFNDIWQILDQDGFLDESDLNKLKKSHLNFAPNPKEDSKSNKCFTATPEASPKSDAEKIKELQKPLSKESRKAIDNMLEDLEHRTP